MTNQKYDYTVEPPEPRKREMATDRKLDTIIDMLKGGDHGEGGDGGSPEVSFEPDPDALPTQAGDEEDEQGEDEAGQGEGTANVSDQNKTSERKFRFPSAKRRAVIER